MSANPSKNERKPTASTGALVMLLFITCGLLSMYFGLWFAKVVMATLDLMPHPWNFMITLTIVSSAMAIGSFLPVVVYAKWFFKITLWEATKRIIAHKHDGIRSQFL